VTARTDSWRRLPVFLIGGVLAVTLLVVATRGPDCMQYLDWSKAVRTGNMGEVGGDLRAPSGLPLTQWSPGPGLYFTLPYLAPTRHLVGDGPFAAVRDFRFMGWLAAIALWCGLTGVLRRVTRYDTATVLFLCVVGFTGTHLGFYSFTHSSEILSFGCLALIAYRLCVSRPLNARDLLGLGTLCGMLVMVRAHLVLYLPLICGVIAWRMLHEQPHDGWPKRAGLAALVVAPLTFAVVQVATVNRWMTGSPMQSPYSFGDAGFRSLDLASPDFFTVLLHPWHGLLVYHPLYALGFALVVAGAFRGSRPARLLHLGIGLTLLAHLWVQASWYCWWLGLWSLGNRGMGVGALLLLPVLAWAMRQASPRGRILLCTASLLCALWSTLMMVQGHSNFYSWPEVLAGQAIALSGLAPMLPVILLVTLATFLMVRDRRPERVLRATATTLLLALVLDHLALRAVEVVHGDLGGLWPFLFRAYVVALAPLTARLDLSPPSARRRSLQPAVLAAVAIALFFWTGLLFLRLVSVTGDVIARGGVQPPGPVATFQVDEVQECHDEYLQVPGYEAEKRALRGFLERHDPR
jgi:hypothetical protein